jgi:hypothetical protein
MKICFAVPDSNWARESGYLEKWERFMANLPSRGDGYELVSEVSLADFVIDNAQEAMHSPVSKLLRPLSRRDVQTISWDMIDRPTGRFSGFYCSLPRQLFDPRRHCSMSYPLPFNAHIADFAREDATLDFSFQGRMTAGVRVRLIRQFQERERELNAVIRESSVMPFTWSDTDRMKSEVRNAETEYADLLRRTKFVLCPRGYGTGTFRMFETMQAGRVPVIISDAYVMPAGIDWDSCSLSIPESRIDEIPGIIASRMGDWEVLAANARSVWEANFSPSGSVSMIARRLGEMAANIAQDSFSPSGHSLRVAGELFQEHARPLAGKLKRLVAG